MPLIRNFNDPDLVPLDNPIEARKNDLLRITEWLNSPAGLKFASKQALLRTTGNLESFSAKDIANAAGRGTVDAASAIATILAQIPLNGTGTHFLFNELSSLAFKNDSFYTGNRNAANQANYRGTITIKGKLGRKNDAALDTYYDNDPINRSVFNSKNEELADSEIIHPDLVPLYFGIQGLSEGKNTTLHTLQFRGFLEGNLADTFTGTWNPTSYVGRGENFYTYQSFRRSLSFGFKTAAFAEEELEIVMEKLSVLASLTAPTYSESGFMKGTMVRLTIGDYVTRLPGTVDNVSITTDFNTPWEITPGLVLPMLSTVSIQFTPIHETIPVTTLGPESTHRTKFIGNYNYPYTDE